MAKNPENLGALLLADVGSVTTRVTLVDTVAGETRLVSQAETPSTIEAPYNDAFIAILEAAGQLGERTGRLLLKDGRLVMPQDNERNGINHLLVTTSATANMQVVIMAIAHSISAQSAQRATRCIYSTVLQSATLDDTVLHPELQRTTSWVERQVQHMISLEPDVIILAGGLEDGAQAVLHRLAHIVAFVLAPVGTHTQQWRGSPPVTCPVIYAGNSHARDGVIDALSGRAETIVVDNVRPALEQERLEGARRQLTRLYEERILSRLPGIHTLNSMASAPVSTACRAEGLMTRFLAERYQRQVLTLQVGSLNSSVQYAQAGQFVPAVLGSCGTGYGLTSLLDDEGLAHMRRWLPFPIDAEALANWLLNKTIRPHRVPACREDVLLEHAVAREVLRRALAVLHDEVPTCRYDLVVASGGVLAHTPHPGLAVLTLLDALQPGNTESALAIELHLDTFGLLAACGALAGFSSEAAVTLFDRDLLGNTPLATCIVALGEGRPDKVALEAELTTTTGRRRRVRVHYGQIARLPLGQGQRAQLVLRPDTGVRIGQNEPGAEVTTGPGEIIGSALGVVIDARGRPLSLPDDDQQRWSILWHWLVALGVEQGQSPYVQAHTELPPTDLRVEPETGDTNGTAASLPAPPAPAMAEPADDKARPGSRVSLEELMQHEQPEPPAAPARAAPTTQAAEPAREPAVEPPGEPARPGSRVSLEELMQQEQAEQRSQPDSAASSEDDDLAQLRQAVTQPEKPKRSGWFRRRKQ